MNDISWKEDAVKASRTLNLINDETINQVLLALANNAIAQTESILMYSL